MDRDGPAGRVAPLRLPHSDIPAARQVPTDVTPDAVAHELTDIPDLIAGW